MKRKRIIFFASVIISTVAFIYYQIDYKRHFIGNRDNTEFITLWMRIGNTCYIIPGKYYGLFPPEKNFIKSVNYRNYIGVLWNTKDQYDYKISIYNEFKKHNLNENIKIYSKNDSLLYEYKILEYYDLEKGIRARSSKSDSLIEYFDYVFIDMDEFWGIEVSRIEPNQP